MADLIERQAALDAIHATFAKSLARDKAVECIMSVPAVDTELEELRQKVKAQEQAMLRVVMQLADKIQTEDTE